ncbi:FkbM family methyltransferase [Mucilaginibacter sp.]
MKALTPDIDQHPEFKPYRSYSQDGEDMLLRPLIAELIPDDDNYKGCYVDIGAYHPYRFSNTMHYYELGWQGINIEPNPDCISLFRQYRERDINLNIGIGHKHETLELYCFADATLNTFDKEVAGTRSAKGNPVVKKVDVEIYPLGQVLDEHLPAGNTIDFMSFDVAGLDVRVLQSNNWDKYQPRFVLVEDTDADFKHLDASEVHEFLGARQYELVSKTQRTLIYRHEKQV